jgi:lipopolysaccharide/colanic/teichoic acid biosynthesis glycosyltransferase
MELSGAPLSIREGWYVGFKTIIETITSVVLLVLTAPVILVAMALVKLTSRGPALYAQRRVGREGRLFTLYKIRSMTHNCEHLTGPCWATARDPRVTPVGRFLRRTHIDELPQLWNVIRGDMSLVGPRPERPEFVTQLERAFPNYQGRHAVLPGITGLAQVQLPPDTDLNGVKRKLACDLYYVERVSLGLDLRILLATATKVVGIPFVTSWNLHRVPNLAAIEDSHRHQAAAHASQVQPAYY